MPLEETRKWRYGVNRWFVLLFIILGIVFAKIYAPIQPHIQVAPERISETPLFGDFYVTNTIIAMLIMDVVILLFFLPFMRSAKRGSLLPEGGFAGAAEAITEMLYGMVEKSGGKATKSIFPWFATIFITVIVANWTELIPGVDSIGILEHAEHEGYLVANTFLPGVMALVQGEGSYHLTAYVRTLSTELNFTAALALISVVMTQVIGIKYQGMGYFGKFFNTHELFSKPFLGVMDFLVGLLEIISEFSKVLSFTFRLFGNVFAGSVLLFLVGSMIPVFVQSMLLTFEFGIGAIQAYVFAMLTLVFMAQAAAGHGGEHEEA